MIDRLKRLRGNDDSGFTLIELLVVITILGVLAAVVVFSVSGVGDKGQKAACKTDTATIRTAQEAFLANQDPGLYAASVDALVPKFLSTTSQWHVITDVVQPTATTSGSYKLREKTPAAGEPNNPCGNAGAEVDGVTNL